MLPQPLHTVQEIYTKIKNENISFTEAERLINNYAIHREIEAKKELGEKNGCSVSKEIDVCILRIHQKLDELLNKTLEALSMTKEAKKL